MGTVVIHSNLNEGMNLSDESIKRCQVFLEHQHAFGRDRIICTGGVFVPEQQGVKHTTACKKWLKDNCFPYNVGTIDEVDTVTTLNDVEESIKLINPGEEIFVITSNYHILRTWLIWKLIGKKSVIMMSAPAKVTIKKLFTEAVGIIVVLCYWVGIKFPELYFRKSSRTVPN